MKTFSAMPWTISQGAFAMPRNLSNRVVLLTGATDPLGRAIVNALRVHRPRFALVSSDTVSLNQLAQSLTQDGISVEAIHADLLQADQRPKVVEAVIKRFGELDLLINAAQLDENRHFAESTSNSLRQITELNYFTPVELMRLAQPYLLTSTMNGNSPAIVNVASSLARVSMAGKTAVAGSQHALAGFHEAVRPEFARFDIEVILMLPAQDGDPVRAGERIVQTLLRGGREVRC
jgi:short-subunit dehydrogenase